MYIFTISPVCQSLKLFMFINCLFTKLLSLWPVHMQGEARIHNGLGQGEMGGKNDQILSLQATASIRITTGTGRNMNNSSNNNNSDKLLWRNIFSLICCCLSALGQPGHFFQKKRRKNWITKSMTTVLSFKHSYPSTIGDCMFTRCTDQIQFLTCLYIHIQVSLASSFQRCPTQTINKALAWSGRCLLVTVCIVQISNYKTNHQWNLWASEDTVMESEDIHMRCGERKTVHVCHFKGK